MSESRAAPPPKARGPAPSATIGLKGAMDELRSPSTNFEEVVFNGQPMEVRGARRVHVRARMCLCDVMPSSHSNHPNRSK